MTPRFICFDLDGTLYLDSCVYLRMITHFFHDTPYKNWILPVQEQMKRVLSGQSALRCGQFVPKQKADHPQTPDDLFDVPGTAALTLSDPSPWLDRRLYSYISDGWTLGMYLARRIGWEGEDFWQRFRLVRKDLIDPAWGPVPDPSLPRLLKDLKKQEIHAVLCSNAQEANCIELLDYLGFDDSCFDELCFDADKPHTFPQRMEEWSRKLGILPEEMLFVGDQGYFDLYAGKQAGASTLLVSPWEAADAGLWDHRVQTPKDMAVYLQELCLK